MRIAVDFTDEIGGLDHFWQSTGFSPARLLLDADMRQAMTYVGSIPHGGITYVRIHYLLELVTAEGLGTEQPEYDWSVLDAALDVLLRNGLRPFFELMGNPSGYFTDFLDDTQVHAWRRLVRDLALHAVERYGQDEVRGWYFETWNEPDVPFWKQSVEAFCNYYDACSEGLKDADEGLRFGGPGTVRTLSSFFKTFLEHCDKGTNYFTGETGVRLDFISVHEKGAKNSREDLNPNTQGIVDREILSIEHIRANHPRFADTPFINDECDPQIGWWDIHTWRARPYYAAIACKIINQHLVRIVDGLGCRYALLSNDNGFVGGWGNRTLLARFGDIQDVPGQSQHRTQLTDLQEDAERKRFEMIKKPILNVMALLSLLGDRRFTARGCGDVSSDVGAIATARADHGHPGEAQVAVLVYNSRDRIMSSGTERIELRLEGLPFDDATRVMLTHYRIDRDHGDPFTVWEEMGAPDNPSALQYAHVRRSQELATLEEPREVEIVDGTLSLDFELPLPGVSLILLSARPARSPGKVENVRVERYEGLADREEVMISWDGVSSRVVRTYEVLYAGSPEGPFGRVNEPDLICTAFLHVRGKADSKRPAEGYKIRAVDYWGRSGEPSKVVTIQRGGEE